MPDVTVGYAKQFDDNVYLLSQQTMSVLRPAVEVDANCKGEEKFFDQVGETQGQEETVRYGHTPNNEVEEDRRRCAPRDYDWGKLFDSIDKVRRLTDPTDKYVQAAAGWFGRKTDETIIAALGGTAYTGKLGATGVDLPSTQKVAVNISGSNTGLTLAKIIAARGKFGLNEVNVNLPQNKLYFVISQKQLDDMLAIEEVTSQDYAQIKALVHGEINTYMGFEFIRTQLLPLNTTTDIRSCYAFAKSGCMLGIWKDRTTFISQNPERKFMWQAYMKMTLGATRMEEAKVVEIACDESP